MVSEWHKLDYNDVAEGSALSKTTNSNLKLCPACDNVKLNHHFAKDRSRKDGLNVYCKHCESVAHSKKLKILIAVGADF